jgi:hypothetical protein
MSAERPLTFQLDQDFLFKYFDARGIDILRSLRLKVSPPNQFNDPFEFLPKVDFCIDNTDVKNRLTDPKWLRSAWEQSGTEISFEEFLTRYQPTFENATAEQVEGVRRQFQEDAVRNQKGVVNFISKTHALACYSEIPDNLLMWSHYTDAHRGIVVQFDLKNSFFSPPANLMPVSYRSDRASAKYDGEGFAFDEHESSVVRIKSLAWSYEREWRQLFQLKDCTKIHDPERTTCFYVNIPSNAIASVIFGVRCRPETEMIVRELKKRPDLQHVRLWRALLHERDFKLNVVAADDKH